MSEDENWCVIPGSMVGEQGMLRLREPAWSDRHELVERLRKGDYAKAFMVDDGTARRLHFGLDYIQSEMSLGDPEGLSLLYTRAMMAFLLFLPRPKHVLIVGLGGGSLTKFCRRELPEARLTAVEIDSDVIRFAEWFDVPAPDARLRLVHADAADYFTRENAPADVILLDGCDAGGTAPAFNNGAFYAGLRAQLRLHGMAVINVTGPPSRVKSHLGLIDHAFEGRTLSIELIDCKNRIVFCWNGEQPSDWKAVAERAEELALRHGLEFPEYAQLLQRAARKHGMRRAVSGVIEPLRTRREKR